MAIIEANTDNFDELTAEGYAVADCYGDFCSACVMLEPVYTSAANDMAFINFSRINISRYPEIADRFNISAIPTLLFFRNGELVHRIEGSMDRAELDGHIACMLYQ